MLRHLMESYVRETQTRYGYQHVWTGHMVKESLYAKSGHLENYMRRHVPADGRRGDALPAQADELPVPHDAVQRDGPHSYRELPLRFAEFATLYRYEKSGALSGLTRVRSLTQDDCHVFCTEDQIQEEFARALQLIREVLDTYGFDDYRVQLSLRGQTRASSSPTTRSGRGPSRRCAPRSTPTAWPTSGRGARRRSMGRRPTSWPRTCWAASGSSRRSRSTSSSRAGSGCEYIGEDGQPHTPVLIHRAVTARRSVSWGCSSSTSAARSRSGSRRCRRWSSRRRPARRVRA